jgi:hypothetical protein
MLYARASARTESQPACEIGNYPPPGRPKRFAYEITSMPDLEKITIAPAFTFTFDALVAGKPGAPLVLHAQRARRATRPSENSIGIDQAAFAISDTRSHVVAFMLGRTSIRASHATRLACGAPSTAHSGVWVKKPTAGATRRSASDMASPAK